MGSLVIGEDRSPLPGRGTVREVRGGGRRASEKTKKSTQIWAIEKSKSPVMP